MPSRRGDNSSSSMEEDNDGGGGGTRRSRRNPRRTTTSQRSKKTNDNDDDDVEMIDTSASSNHDEESDAAVLLEDEEDDDEEEMEGMEEEEEVTTSRRSSRRSGGGGGSSSGRRGRSRQKNNNNNDATATVKAPLRASSRSTQFKASMAEPTESIRDLLQKPKTSDDNSEDYGNDSTSDYSNSKPKSRARTVAKKVDNKPRAASSTTRRRARPSPRKSPARRRSASRTSRRRKQEDDDSSSEDDFAEDANSTDDENDDDDEEEGDPPPKLQRIIACRSETLSAWKELTRNMNTDEVTAGSMWTQEEENNDAEGGGASAGREHQHEHDAHEERFLVKWNGLSYLHVSWETERDLLEQCEENAKTYLTTFFRKQFGGLLFTADERCDGDFFDPAWTQIDRILEVDYPDHYDGKRIKFKAEDEDSYTAETFGIVTDRSSAAVSTPEEYDKALGRVFLVKWCNQSYEQMTYEYERDLILQEVDYKEHVKACLRRHSKPKSLKKREKQGMDEFRKLRSVFGEDCKLTDAQHERAVRKVQQELQDFTYPNGGQLRDYQAEGVSWMLSNYVNDRGMILADEMGLGKTLQTAAMADILYNKFQCTGPTLVIAPLSTLHHWRREFQAWTPLNCIVYHGSATDRTLLREQEFVYPADRPAQPPGLNQLYLKKCTKKSTNPWMVQVVLTTPEMVVTDDFIELTAIPWELLVVDEAHRIKNHTSKLAVNLRDKRFQFNHKLLLTGTPIQNDVHEFWTLLNFIDGKSFARVGDFLERYGDMKSKERVDELHEEIRPYILRRLKEDVEKSVPPKEETLIEVELTVSQKKYYRALYERNVKFLHRNHKKPLDGPSLNNLAMQLRKCCNHLFLLTGVEEEFRTTQPSDATDGDLLVRASGKLVLLDKLLPRLQQQGHRVLLFSQFKIMLDILEDYFHARKFKFERIDGSITGSKRQQAIDRFQAPADEANGKELPFIMMLSTRAGGVGINLTAADTCIIFDSDWNPQNDAQAQARCHRIGQTKSVKVYRLLTRKTYEMQMFHMSSMKLGLDQAVLKGFETGGTNGGAEAALSKDEVEKLLRHGAYDILNEDKSGSAEAESKDFEQQDIDAILERRSRTVVHENTGSNGQAGGGAAGSTFSKARFTAAKSPEKAGGASAGANKEPQQPDVDINDPDFWKKMLGEPAKEEADDLYAAKQPRQRKKTNYSEKEYMKQLDRMLVDDPNELVPSPGGTAVDSDAEEEDADDDEDENDNSNANKELVRGKWGGKHADAWHKDDAEKVTTALSTFGYGGLSWADFCQRLGLSKEHSTREIRRMCWALILCTVLDVADDDAASVRKREVKAAEKREQKAVAKGMALPDAAAGSSSNLEGVHDLAELKRSCFEKLWDAHKVWAKDCLEDAVEYFKEAKPRDQVMLDRAFNPNGAGPTPAKEKKKPDQAEAYWAESVWPSLKTRGWKAEVRAPGKTVYMVDGKEYASLEAVLPAAQGRHPELAKAIETVQEIKRSSQAALIRSAEEERSKYSGLSVETASPALFRDVLDHFAPIQLVADRRKTTRLRLSRRILSHCSLLYSACSAVRRSNATDGNAKAIAAMANSLDIDKRITLPHPAWTPRHDAVMVFAIAKHGWIDQDSSSRAISNDASIQWGAPFDKSGVESVVAPSTNSGGDAKENEEDTEEVLQTAERAATLLNQQGEMLDQLKGFHRDLVIRSYGLVRKSDENAGTWVVDRTLVDGTGKLSHELCDLPPKKDLARRAKTILSRGMGTSVGAGTSTTRPTYNYSVLDQSDRSNLLLAEMTRAVLKGSIATFKEAKKLLVLALAEARVRVERMRKAKKDAKTIHEMTRIVQHLELVSANMHRPSSQQFRNVIRVVLGEDVVPPKNPKETMFPVPRSTPSLNNMARGNKATAALTCTGAERVIELAEKRFSERMQVDETRKRNHGLDEDANILQLTEVETLILSVVCSMGLPTGDPDQALSTATTTNRLPQALTWAQLGQSVVDRAQACLRSADDRVRLAQKDFARIASVVSDPQAKAAAGNDLWHVQKAHQVKSSAASQAEEYAKEPETLAKKAIMLLEKCRRHMGPVHTTAFTSKSEHGLGSKVLQWFTKELQRWAAALELLDDVHRPLAFTAVDFFPELTPADQKSVHIASSFDRKGCRAAVSQVAALSRARSTVCSHGGDNGLVSRVEKAVNQIAAEGDVWAQQPPWWTDNGGGTANGAGMFAQKDVLLLERLLQSGYTGVLYDTRSFSHGGMVVASHGSFKDGGLTKRAVQLRLNQLVRELHNIEESSGSNSLRVLEERRNVPQNKDNKGMPGTKKIGMTSTNPAASSSTAAPPATSTSGGGGTNPADDDRVEVVSPPERQQEQQTTSVAYSDVEIVERPSKRKDDSTHYSLHKKDSGGDGSSDGTSPSPEKKLRTTTETSDD